MTIVLEIDRRCLRHPAREAVARCPQCRDFFCRECITEHDDRVLCANCLAQMRRGQEARGSVWAAISSGLLAILGLFTVWTFFYLAGQSLADAPSSFHEGTIWEKLLPDNEEAK